MSQEAPSNNLANEKGLANEHEQTRSTMQVHRDNLQAIQDKLNPMNLRNISDAEVTDYQEQVNNAKVYVISIDNKPIIHQFVPAVEKFETFADDIILDFNNALQTWTWFRESGRSAAQYREGEREYEKCLNECRKKFVKLLAELKNL